MSMAHKAFLFDTETFHSTIEPVMKACVANPEAARKYICEHYSQFQSPYTGEVLEGYPDAANHSIDAARYALEPVWKRRGQ